MKKKTYVSKIEITQINNRQNRRIVIGYKKNEMMCRRSRRIRMKNKIMKMK